MADLPPATLRLHIDRQALAHNWRTLDAMSGTASAGAAVKANAYGVGVDMAVPALRDAGCGMFFVAHWSEVAAVLRHVPAGRVAVLHGVSSDAEVAYALVTGAVPVINSPVQAARWTAAGGGTCHVMVDSGINRLGVTPEQVGDPAIAALDVDVLLSHLASADEDVAQNGQQLAVFRQIAATRPARRRSMANSAGIALGRDYAFDLTRPGISLYGGIARGELEGEIRQVVFPEAAVIQRRRLSAGDSIGYNATFTAERDMELATLSIGYADGFLRCRGPGTILRFGDAALPIVGRVSMDMVVVDCSAAPGLREGDFLRIPMNLPEVAARSGLSQYELLTTLGNRFDRK